MIRLIAIVFIVMISPFFLLSQCEALFSWDDTNQTIQFYDESTVAPGDQIVSWFWDFDDDDAVSTLQNPRYTFSEPDKFDVTLTITTANGCTSELEIRIEICNFSISMDVGACEDNDSILVTMTVRDVYDSADEFDIILDGNVLPGGPYDIEEESPVTLSFYLAGDGLMHQLVVQSADVSTCKKTFELLLPDCTSNCFLSSFQVALATNAEHTILIGDNFFRPVDLTMEIGDLVIFDWVGDGHSTTSDATAGPDSWNSGVIGIGSIYELNLRNPGIHPYYCLPHGSPGGVGMAGSIVANCPPGGNFDLNLNFNTSIADIAGYNIYIDNILLTGSPFLYNIVGSQGQTIPLAGDGLEHIIRIEDVADPSCVLEKLFIAPDCGNAPACTLAAELNLSGGCDVNNQLPYDLFVTDINGGNAGINLIIDGVLDSGSPYSYDATGTTLIEILLPGDGLTHSIQVVDVIDPSCSNGLNVTTSDCLEPCVLSELAIVQGTSITHNVNVEDFTFAPRDITITAGDRVQWDWTGQIPHTATSDATTGPDSWDSGLLGNGDTYTSPVLSEGLHPYYCIPHGGPGGVGMAGTISVVPDCENGMVQLSFNFSATGNGFSGYNIFLDGILYSQSPLIYETSGVNSFVVTVAGDGFQHEISVQDVDDPSCLIALLFDAPDCDPGLCSLQLEVEETGPCDDNDKVPVQVSVSDINGSALGFNLFIDSVIDLGGPYNYDVSGVTMIESAIIGDGELHTYLVLDVADAACSGFVNQQVTQCGDCLAFESNFSYAISDATVTLENISSQNSNFWLWGFGDGNTSTEYSPVHTYAAPGIYTVCMLAQDTLLNCFDELCENLVIESTSTEDIVIEKELQLFPNPCLQDECAELYIRGLGNIRTGDEFTIQLYDINAKQVSIQKMRKSDLMTVAVNGLSSGIYYFRVFSANEIYSGSIIIQ